MDWNISLSLELERTYNGEEHPGAEVDPKNRAERKKYHHPGDLIF